jgi:hypothetical protein
MKRDELMLKSVNNKYLVENEISTEENLSNYLVTDFEKKDKYVLCILKNNFIYEKTREYLLSKFKTIKNLNFDNIVNIIKIEIIYNINGIKLDKPQYGYLMENIELEIDTKKYLKKCKSYKKLDIFMELCAVINTLNIQGYIFDNITIKDIKLVHISKNRVKVKIKNLLQGEISKFTLLNSYVNSVPHEYNIESMEDSNANVDNIEHVIELINQIFTQEELENELKELNSMQESYNQLKKLNKPFKLKYFIKEINYKMNTNYSLFIFTALNKLQTDLDIIGMREEMKIVEKNLQKILQNKENCKIISFNGQDGSGKTRFLKEIKYRIENKYFNKIIYVSDFCNKNMTQEEKYRSSVNYIFKNIDKNLKDKYEIYIKKFISIIFRNDSINNQKNQTLQLINRIGKFLKEYAMIKPCIIIIDDLDQKHEIVKLFIRYIIFFEKKLGNVMIIFSMNEDRSDQKFLKFINELKELQYYEEYKIKKLKNGNKTNY